MIRPQPVGAVLRPILVGERCKKWAVPILLLSILPLYLAFRSISLDDFDSYSFALALTDFSIALQQPQPPGFPVYIAIGRALHALVPEPVWVLTLLSALSGTAAVLLVYGIGKLMDADHPSTALLGALCFALTPMGWLTAEKALSDMPGLMWVLLAIWLWLLWRKPHEGGPALLLGAISGLITGLTLGVRPQNALPIVLLVGESLLLDLRQITHQRRHAAAGQIIASWLIVIIAGTAGLLVWLIPTAVASGGLRPYLEAVAAHASHVGRADALFGLQMPLPVALRTRALASLDTLLTGLAGTDLYTAPALARRSMIAMALIGVPALIATDWRRAGVRRLGLWTAAVLAQTFFFETLDRPRLFLPALPWLALLIASGLVRLCRRRGLRIATTALLPLLLMLRSLPLVVELSRIAAPPAQAAAYIKQHYPPEQTLIAAAGSFRAAQVELPAYPLLYLYRFDIRTLVDARASGLRYVVIIDRDQFPFDIVSEMIATLSQGEGGSWIPLEDHTFIRDRHVHTQHDQVRVQVLTPQALVPPELLALPPNGCIAIGAEDTSGRYLGDGWFRPEEIAGAQARWAGGTLTSTLRIHMPPPSDSPAEAQRVRLRALAYPPEQTLSISFNGVATAPVPLDPTWHEVAWTLSTEAFTGEPIMTLKLVHASAASPFDRLDGASSDTRRLTAAYDWICIEPDTASTGN